MTSKCASTGCVYGTRTRCLRCGRPDPDRARPEPTTRAGWLDDNGAWDNATAVGEWERELDADLHARPAIEDPAGWDGDPTWLLPE